MPSTPQERLRKLIQHEQSARAIGSLPEAEAFAARISQLLIEHKLQLSDIDMEEHEAEPIIEVYATAVKSRRYREDWCEVLASGVSRMTGTDYLVVPGSNSVFFVGRKSDAENALTHYVYLSRLAVQMAEAEGKRIKSTITARIRRVWGESSFGRQSQAMKEWRYGFVAGFALATSSRMRATVAEMLEAAASSPGTALMRRDSVAIKEHIQQRGIKKAKGSTRNHMGMSADGYNIGKQVGTQVSLSAHKELKQ